jgi:hypothetical protein
VKAKNFEHGLQSLVCQIRDNFDRPFYFELGSSSLGEIESMPIVLL